MVSDVLHTACKVHFSQYEVNRRHFNKLQQKVCSNYGFIFMMAFLEFVHNFGILR